MRTLFQLLCFLGCFLAFTDNSNAQTPFTNRQVYNYNVGDVMQSQRYQNAFFGGAVTSYETQYILGKRTSLKNDTLFYTIAREYLTLGIDPLYFKDTIVQYYTDLDQEALHYNETTILALVDRYYDSFCNVKVWEKHPDYNNDTAAMYEPVEHTTYYVEGLGGPYFYKMDPKGPQSSLNHLTYYKKGNNTCGNFFSGVNILNADKNPLKVNPNPIINQASIESSRILKNATLSIFNHAGQLVRTQTHINGNGVTLERGELKPGIYQLQLEDQGKVSVAKIAIL